MLRGGLSMDSSTLDGFPGSFRRLAIHKNYARPKTGETMRKVRFRDPAGSVRVGEWRDEEIRFAGRSYSPDEVTILPPSNPSKIVGVGLNYEDHIKEYDMSVPDRPLLFLLPPSSLSSHGHTVTLPEGKEQVDYEAEIGIVIDTECRNVSEADAMDVVRGFTCVNEISNRDDQMDTISGNLDLVRGKAFDNSTVVGPVVASPDEVPSDASIELRQNGELRQESSRDQLLFDVPSLIKDLTSLMTLESGDIITTGTTSGVGPLADGDEIEVTVEGVGTLRHHVAQG